MIGKKTTTAILAIAGSIAVSGCSTMVEEFAKVADQYIQEQAKTTSIASKSQANKQPQQRKKVETKPDFSGTTDDWLIRGHKARNNKQEKLACSYFEKVAEQGNSNGQLALAPCYLKSDSAKALDLIEKSVSQNNPEAYATLAALYQEGEVVPKDLDKSLELLNQAAKLGDSSAQFLLAVAHSSKTDIYPNVETDWNKAAYWAEKAASSSSNKKVFVSSQMLLGKMYSEGGNGLKKNRPYAKQWYEKAASNGNKQAKNILSIFDCQNGGVANGYAFLYPNYLGPNILASTNNGQILNTTLRIERNCSSTRIKGVYECGEGVILLKNAEVKVLKNVSKEIYSVTSDSISAYGSSQYNYPSSAFVLKTDLICK